MARTTSLLALLAGVSCVLVAGGCASHGAKARSFASPSSVQLAAAAGAVAEHYTESIVGVPEVIRPPVCAQRADSKIGLFYPADTKHDTFTVSTKQSGEGWISTVVAQNAPDPAIFGHPSQTQDFRWRVILDKGHLVIC